MLAVLALAAALVSAPSLQRGDGTAAASPTFARDVAPILFRSCTTCHRPGQPAPFSLITYQDARRHAQLLARVTAARVMPPWQPDPGHGDFVGERRLTATEIATIGRWAAAGAPEGEASDTPPVPVFPNGWMLGTPDAIVRLPQPYLLPASGPDRVRTFVVPSGIRQRRFVRAIQFSAGTTRAIHHANIKIDTLRSSRWLDEQDPGEGYEGAGGRSATFPDGHFLGWTPGQSARVTDDAPWQIDAGADLVLELHLTPTGKEEQIQPAVALYFTDRPATLSPYMIRIGRQDLDIPPGAAEHRVVDSYVLPVAVHVLAVQPHAHNLARSVRLYAQMSDGRELPLLSISRWDPRWQDVYRYRAPVFLPQGTRIVAEYVFDNTAANPRNPHNPPSRVIFGQTAADEMGDVWLQVLTADNESRQVLDDDYMPKMRHEDVNGARMVLQGNGQDPRAHTDLAFCLTAAGEDDEALQHFAAAVDLQPQSAGTRLDLGVALIRANRLDEAQIQLDEAIRINPGLSEAWGKRGAVSHLKGDLRAALSFYQKALTLNPDDAEVNYNIGRVHSAAGAYVQAVAHYQAALAVVPDDPSTLTSLGSALAATGQIANAIAADERAVAVRPSFVPALVDLAWLFATSDPPYQRPSRAVALAERASELVGGSSPTVLDTLAAAYAAAGRRDEAIRIATRALELAAESGADALAERIRARLQIYGGMLDGSDTPGKPPTTHPDG